MGQEVIQDGFSSFLAKSQEERFDFVMSLQRDREKMLLAYKKKAGLRRRKKPAFKRKAPEGINPELRELFDKLPEKSKRLFVK